MNQFWKEMGISMIMGLLVPAVVLSVVVSIARNRSVLLTPQEETIFETTVSAQTEPLEDTRILVLSEESQTIEMELCDYLTGVVLAEMPVSFEDEALKAQSVVARTYIIRASKGASKHDPAAVCMDSACCQGYLAPDTFLIKGGNERDVQRIRELIAETAGEVLTYEGELIEATYFSCSGGVTEDAVAVWGTDVPYLQSVESPGEEHAAHYTDTVTFSAEEFASRLGISLTGRPSGWFSNITYTEGGGVASIKIGTESFSGTQLRRLLGLRSTAFEIATEDDSISVTTRGYGHRVGMSQYGANAMAASGSTYGEILTYYYQGTQLTTYTD
jgi:stage II sporulation protein D